MTRESVKLIRIASNNFAMPFVKGQSGNPTGGSKKSAAIKELAQAHCEKAIIRLSQLLDSDDEAIVCKAADLLLERGYGKAPQSTESNISGTLTIVCKGMPSLAHHAG